MFLKNAIEVMTRTHIGAILDKRRANSYELISVPGLGKSSAVRQYCKKLSREINQPTLLVVEMLATLMSADVRGFLFPTKASATSGSGNTLDTLFSTPSWYPVRSNIWVFEPDETIPGGIREWAPGTWPVERPLPVVGVVFLDEYGQAEDDVKKAGAELLLHGQVGTTILPMNIRVIAASNRMNDRSGVLRPLMFVINRRGELPIEPSLSCWKEWEGSLPPGHPEKPHFLTVAFADREAGLVFRSEVPPGTGPFCTPRTLVMMDQELRALRTQEQIDQDKLPMDPVAREVVSGWIGKGEGAQYFAHLQFADQLPDFQDILNNPGTAKVPQESSAQMICAYMLAHHIEEDNAAVLLRYLNRLKADMQILAVRTINLKLDKAQALSLVPEYNSWCIRHADVLKASNA